MSVFLTSATGYIGSVVAEKLIQAGHQVVGLARSDASAAVLQNHNIEVARGELDDLSVIRQAVGECDGVIHAGFKQHPAGFTAAMVAERAGVRAMIEGLGNEGKPLLYTGGTGMLGDTQDIVFDESIPDRFTKGKAALDDQGEMERAGLERRATEAEVLGTVSIKGIVLRPPNIYGRSNGHALIASLIDAARKIRAVPYPYFSTDHLWAFV